MNLRELCRLPQFPSVLLTTYNLDPLFFERVILADLIAGGASRIIVLADASQAIPAINQAQGQLMALGRRYRLIPVRLAGSFHPKICIRLGQTGAVVACGSTNLTRAGWLGCRSGDDGGGNREAATSWRVSPGSPAAASLRRVAEVLASIPDSPSDRENVRQLLTPSWLERPISDEVIAWDWRVFGKGQTLSSVLQERWRGRRFERLRMVTGSTDQHAAMIRWAAATFGIRQAIIEMDLACCGFDPVKLTDMPIDLRIVPYDGRPRTHMKLALFESAAGSAAVVGSANCSGAAWLRTAGEGGNIEAAVITDHCKTDEFAGLFRVVPGGDRRWDEVGLTGPAPAAQPASQPQKYALLQLQLRRSAGQLTALLEPTPPPGAICTAVVDGSRVPLSWTGHGGTWIGPQPDLRDGITTLFGHLDIASHAGSSGECTPSMWVDDVDLLSEVAGRHNRFDAVRRLSAAGPSREYRRLLEDLHVLTQTLLSNPAEFPDGVTVPTKKEKKPEGEPPKPVTAADIVRTLDQLTSPQNQIGHAAPGLGGAISLTGVLRMLFSEGDDGIDVDPTAAEHQESEEERDKEQDEDGSTAAPRDAEEDKPSDAQRRRFIDQLHHFVERLGDPVFSTTCSARQLQQAAAYPLAVARFATRGRWVTEKERGQLAQVVARTCEVLMFRSTLEIDGRASRQRNPLLQEVRQRYAAEGRADDFDQILGDGALWLVLIASLGVMGTERDGTFGRNLTLCDVARYPYLSATAVPQHLAPLMRRLGMETTGQPFVRLRELAGWFGLLEEYLAEGFEKWKNARTRPCVGDWLWRPGMGFGQITELGEAGKAKVHIRKKAETLKSVLLSYYVNVREIAETDAFLRSLLEACSQ